MSMLKLPEPPQSVSPFSNPGFFTRFAAGGIHKAVAAARAGLGDGIVIMPFTEENALKSGDPDVARRSIRTMFEQAGSPRDFVVDIVPPPAAPVEYLWPAVDEAKRLSRGFFHGVA